MNWQPIETAPKDRWVMVWLSGGGIAITNWGTGRPSFDSKDRIAGWVDYDNLDYGDVEFVITPPPTHWMPLPEGPA